MQRQTSAENRGELGELRVEQLMSEFLTEEYYYLPNLLLEFKSGVTTQIDNTIISPYGVFVVEVKNMSGVIQGKSSNIKWTQKVGNKQFKFYNPIRQNLTHCKIVKELLRIPDVISIVTFKDSTKLEITNTSVTRIVKFNDLIPCIDEFQYKRFSIKQVEDMWVKLASKNLAFKPERVQAHVAAIKNRHHK